MTNINDFSDSVLGFYLSSRQTYHEAIKHLDPHEVEHIMIGRYYPNSCCVYEFRFQWKILGGKVVASVNIYDSSIVYLDDFKHVLECFKDLAQKSVNQTPSPEDFCNKLIEIGLTELRN